MIPEIRFFPRFYRAFVHPDPEHQTLKPLSWKLTSGHLSPSAKIVGAVFNDGWAKLIPSLDGVADIGNP